MRERACYTALVIVRRILSPLSLAVALATLSVWLQPDGSAAGTPAIAQVRAPAIRASPARHVDRTQLMRDVGTLASPAFEGRRTGSPGGLKARDWIRQQFSSIGLAPAGGQGFEQSFSFAARDVRERPRGSRGLGRGEYKGANVIGRLAGSDPQKKILVITAHYDHLGVVDGVLYPGADDNGSGVAALLAIARHFKMAPPRHTLVFAALDGEEQGLHGARTLVRSGLLASGRVALNVNLDMLARSDRGEIYAAGSFHSPWQVPILQDVQTRSSVRILFGHDRPERAANGVDDWTHSSDHGAFHDAGIPFVYFGVEDHPDYHEPGDTTTKIDPRFFGDVTDMVIEAIRAFDVKLQ